MCTATPALKYRNKRQAVACQPQVDTGHGRALIRVNHGV